MWTRRELKAKAKETLKRNYWKTVLVALLFTLVCGGAGITGAASGSGGRAAQRSDDAIVANSDQLSSEEVDQMLQDLEQVDMTDVDNPPVEEIENALDQGEDDGFEYHFELGFPPEISPTELLVVVGVISVIVIVALAIALAFSAFIANPVEIGTARFFTRNLNQPAEVKEVAFGFDHNYLHVVKVMFARDIRTLLWGLLLVIPGIVKAYEYRMMPYLLADDPTMTKDQAFAESKRMMTGNKWRAFVLDLSFIGWYLLAIPTLGLVTVLYASPYKRMTDAALYEELRYGQNGPQEGTALPAPVSPTTTTDQVPVPPFAAADAPAPVWDDEPTE